MASRNKRYIFLVDDEPFQNEMLKDYLSERYIHEIKVYENGEEALQHMHLQPEIIVLDFHLNANKADAMNGVEVLKRIKQAYPPAQVIMLSGQDKIEVAIDSMKFGAYDYVVKGETAFSRTENIINNISELRKARNINKAYRKTILALGLVIAGIVALSLYLWRVGAYKSL